MSNIRVFSSSTKLRYSRGVKPNMVNFPGSNFYVNLMGNPIQLRQINNFINNNPKNGPTPPEPINQQTKIVAILDFSDEVYDQPIKKTLNYYFNNVPKFYKFPIVDFGGDFDKLLELLDEYYSKGFRYFLTATLTPTLVACIDWFNNHPDAQGISSQSKLLELSIPKSIYRMAFSDIWPVTQKQVIDNYDAVFYFYNNTNQAVSDWNDYLQARCQNLNIPYVSYGINSSSEITDDFVNNTMASIQELITNNSYSNVSISSTLVEWQDIFYNKFVEGTTTTPSNSTFYNVGFALPNITETDAISYFNNIDLYAQLYGNLNTSPLWRQGLVALTETNFSIDTLNMMEILYKMEQSNGYIFEIGSHSGALLFSLVTRDQTYESYVYELFTVNEFIPSIIYFRSPDSTIFKALI